MSKPKIDNSKPEIPLENEQYEEPVYLKDDPIYFIKAPLLKSRAKVPPPTPDLNIQYTRVKDVPEIHVSKIEEVPKVKEEGIKFTIENLGQQLGLGYYEYDLIQFWLLDMLTDCVWKAQEISHFKDHEQKVVLNWITAFFKVIADPILNISRKDFLKLFKEVLLQCYKKISNKFEFPSTDLLDEVSKKYVLEEAELGEDNDEEDDGEEEESESSSSSRKPSLSTLSIENMDHIVIYPEFNIKEHIFKLKNNNPLANAYHCYSETIPPSTRPEQTVEEEQTGSENDYLDLLLDQDVSFYKPDIETPTRFRSSLEIEDISQPPYVCKCLFPEDNSLEILESGELGRKGKSCKEQRRATCKEQIDLEYLKNKDEEVPIIEEKESTKSSSNQLRESLSAFVKNMSASSQILSYLAKGKYEQIFPKPCMKGVRPVDIFTLPEPEEGEETILTEEELEKIKERELMNEWTYFLMMEQRGWDMDDPKVGWVPWMSFLEKEKGSLEEFIPVQAEVISSKSSFEEFDSDRARNFKMLKAIVDFVFEYFYENFHFTLIKLAFRSTPITITQELNSKWLTPKVIKQEFKRPKPAKKKKDKKKKDKKKSSKGSKQSKKKKGDKKSKSPKKDKKKKKENKPKKPKLTKAELAMLRKLAELEEEERIKREENRVFMFPLADAASENLFMSIFENWVKNAANGKKDKKGNKGKGNKKK